VKEPERLALQVKEPERLALQVKEPEKARAPPEGAWKVALYFHGEPT
jgi:hypothetical protein